MVRAQQASVLGAYIGSCVSCGAPARSGERRRDAQRPRPGYFSRNQRRRALCIYYYVHFISIFAPPTPRSVYDYVVSALCRALDLEILSKAVLYFDTNLQFDPALCVKRANV